MTRKLDDVRSGLGFRREPTRIKLGEAIDRWRNLPTDPTDLRGRVTFQLELVYTTKTNAAGRRVTYGPYGPYWYVYYWTGLDTPPSDMRPRGGRSKMRSRYVGRPDDVDPRTITASALGKLIKERPWSLKPDAEELPATVPARRVKAASGRQVGKVAVAAGRTFKRKVEGITLVACSAAKAKEPKRARSLYTSDWFRKARSYAEAREAVCGDPWFILSAEHGLVHPDTELAPYDVRLDVIIGGVLMPTGERSTVRLLDSPSHAPA